MKNILLIGCGDIAQRLIPSLIKRYRVLALLRPSSPDALQRAQHLRSLGVRILWGDLDYRKTLARLAGLAYQVIHLAPPTPTGASDERTRRLLARISAYSGAIVPQWQQKSLLLPRKNAGRAYQSTLHRRRLIYLSTTGVYGDCQGAWVDETRPVAPHTARAHRRVDAEQQIRRWGAKKGRHALILRLPGIYAAERLPLSRFASQIPLICQEEDSWGNHIHAGDVCRAIRAILHHHAPNRLYNVCDRTPLKIGDYYDVLADALGYARLPRLPRAQAEKAHTPGLWSYMQESRRICSARLLHETHWRPRYPDIVDAVQHIAQQTHQKG